MRSHMLRNNVLGAALACAFAAAPLSQTLAQDADGQMQKSAASQTDNQHAVAKAKAVKGVKSVNASNLRVNAMHADSSMDKAEHTMSAGDTSAPAMAAGSNGNMHKSAENHMDNQTVPDKAADAWITTKVKTELATAKHVKASDISVETNDGAVMLSGMVPSKSGKMNAVKKAKAVKGVKSVDASSLKVGTVEPASSMHNADHPMSDMPAPSSTAGH